VAFTLLLSPLRFSKASQSCSLAAPCVVPIPRSLPASSWKLPHDLRVSTCMLTHHLVYSDHAACFAISWRFFLRTPPLLFSCPSSIRSVTPHSAPNELLLEPPDENTLRIMIATDNHVGFLERDPVRGPDSFAALEGRSGRLNWPAYWRG